MRQAAEVKAWGADNLPRFTYLFVQDSELTLFLVFLYHNPHSRDSVSVYMSVDGNSCFFLPPFLLFCCALLNDPLMGQVLRLGKDCLVFAAQLGLSTCCGPDMLLCSPGSSQGRRWKPRSRAGVDFLLTDLEGTGEGSLTAGRWY